MSLIVTTFHRDENGKFIDDPYPEAGEDLAGVEDWRKTVWGSKAAIDRGLRFLPQLNQTDLYIENDELPDFLKECQTLMKDIDNFSKDLGHRSSETIAHRLNNFIKAANRVLDNDGGVYIG